MKQCDIDETKLMKKKMDVVVKKVLKLFFLVKKSLCFISITFRRLLLIMLTMKLQVFQQKLNYKHGKLFFLLLIETILT